MNEEKKAFTFSSGRSENFIFRDVCVITQYVVVVSPPSAFILAQVLLEIIIAVATDTHKNETKSQKIARFFRL